MLRTQQNTKLGDLEYYFLYHTFRTKLRYNSVPQIKITLLHKQQPTIQYNVEN